MSKLIGARELKARLKAMQKSFKPVAREWADETVTLIRPQIPVRTGKTRKSVRRGRVTAKRATVVGSYVINFLNAGTVAHDERPKVAKTLVFESGGRTIFAKKVHHPQTRGQHFKGKAARDALDKVDLGKTVTDAWNGAA